MSDELLKAAAAAPPTAQPEPTANGGSAGPTPAQPGTNAHESSAIGESVTAACHANPTGTPRPRARKRERAARKPDARQREAAALALHKTLPDVAKALVPPVAVSTVYAWVKTAWWTAAQRDAAAADVALIAGLRIRGKAAAMATLTKAAEAGDVDAARGLEAYVRDTAAEKRQAAWAERDRVWLDAVKLHAADRLDALRAAVLGDDDARLDDLSLDGLRREAGVAPKGTP